jgi:gamma-glutamyltranspeptidase/glutathione hydrolase
MRRTSLRPLLAVVLAAALPACGHGPAPSAPAPSAPSAPIAADAALAPTQDAGADAALDAGAAASRPAALPVYRTAASDYHVDPRFSSDGATTMVVSEDAAASQIGHQILAAGGNAVDAAVATAFALAVSHPSAGNLGGGGFALIRTAPGKVVALDFRETAPAAATADMYLDAAGKPTDASITGHRAAGVPGSVAGLWALHRKLGKLPWKQVVHPAMVLARDGFAVDATLHQKLVRNQPRLARFPASAALWLPGGAAAAVGAVIRNPDLAATLAAIEAHGRDGFYLGPVAALIVDEMQRGGGLITAADLRGYQPVWRTPLEVAYRGYHLATMPPPSSSGIVVAIAAGVLGHVELGKLPWHGVAHVHWLAEVWRRAYAARNELLGDPAYVKDPLGRLTSAAYLDALAKTIDPDHATPSKDTPAILGGLQTTNLATVDAMGMAVALTTTINTTLGSGVTVTGAGFLLNNEMDDFTVKPGSPNTYGLVQGVANKIEPGKRMLSSMSPTIVEDGHHGLVMAVGAGGGPLIITTVFQVMSNVLDFHLPLAAALDAPRVHHQHLPDTLAVEPDGIDEATAQALTARGHKLQWAPEAMYSHATAILRVGTHYTGAVDPREGGAAVGD